MTDNPRDWQPPFEDDDEFWRRFEDSLNRAQGNRGDDSPSSNPPGEPSRTPPEPDDVFMPPEPPPISAPSTPLYAPLGFGTLQGCSLRESPG